MMRFIIYFVFITAVSFAYAKGDQTQRIDGKYYVEQYGEKLIDGSQVYLKYNIDINNNGKTASIKIITWHAPIVCDGDFTIKNEKGMFLLSFIGAKNSCMYPSPQYEIKRVNNKLYIRGRAMAYSQEIWLKLTSRK